MPPPMMMVPMGPPMLYDVKIKRCIKSGQLKCKNIPPEDFLIDPNATKLRDGGGLECVLHALCHAGEWELQSMNRITRRRALIGRTSCGLLTR